MAQQPGRANLALEEVMETALDGLGFELVELEKAGPRARPILRLRIDRIDRADSEPGGRVTVDDCARVSRELESVLEAREDLQSSYILEVSSPGLERPLRKPRDFERNVGREISVRGFGPLIEDSKRVDGILLAVDGSGESACVHLRHADGTQIRIPLVAIARARTVFDWSEFNFSDAGKQLDKAE